MAQNLTPDAQYYVRKNISELRDKFAGFFKRFTQPVGNSEESRVITAEDIYAFFDEMTQ